MLGTPPLQTLRRHRGARPRGGRARLHRAQDQHRHPRRSGRRVLPRLRQRHQHTDGAPTVEILDADRAADRHLPRGASGRTSGSVSTSTTTSAPRASCASPSCSSSSTCSGWSTTTGIPTRCCRSSSRPRRGLASCESLVSRRQYRPFLEKHAMDVADHRRALERLLASRRRSAGWPTRTRSTSPRTTTTATWPTCTRCTCARCCPTCASWRSTSTTCRGRTTSSPRRRRSTTATSGQRRGPGWGADIDERVLKEHPWPRPGDKGTPLFYGMDPRQMTTRP